MGFREMRGGDGVSDVEIRRNEIIELLYTYKKYSISLYLQVPEHILNSWVKSFTAFFIDIILERSRFV